MSTFNTAFPGSCRIAKSQKRPARTIDERALGATDKSLSLTETTWPEVLDRYNQSVPGDFRFWHLLCPLDRHDPRRQEIQVANRRMFIDRLKREIADPSDRSLLSALGISSCVALFAPLVGVSIAVASAVLVSVAWMRAHS